MKKLQGFAVLAMLLTVSGCATAGRSSQMDIDALNARVTALQGQLAEKDQEISNLQNQVNDQKLAREAAETAMHDAENQRRAMADKMQSESRNAPASDLK